MKLFGFGGGVHVIDLWYVVWAAYILTTAIECSAVLPPWCGQSQLVSLTHNHLTGNASLVTLPFQVQEAEFTNHNMLRGLIKRKLSFSINKFS